MIEIIHQLADLLVLRERLHLAAVEAAPDLFRAFHQGADGLVDIAVEEIEGGDQQRDQKDKDRAAETERQKLKVEVERLELTMKYMQQTESHKLSAEIARENAAAARKKAEEEINERRHQEAREDREKELQNQKQWEEEHRHSEERIKLLLQQLEELRKEVGGVNSTIENNRNKEKTDAMTKQLASMRTTKMSIIYSFLSAKRLGIDYDLNGKIYQDLPKVTLQDVVNYEKQLMANKQYRYIILGDEKNLDIPSLEKIAPVKRLTTEEVFGY
jgi:chromosome segregation ATPase